MRQSFSSQIAPPSGFYGLQSADKSASIPGLRSLQSSLASTWLRLRRGLYMYEHVSLLHSVSRRTSSPPSFVQSLNMFAQTTETSFPPLSSSNRSCCCSLLPCLGACGGQVPRTPRSGQDKLDLPHCFHEWQNCSARLQHTCSSTPRSSEFQNMCVSARYVPLCRLLVVHHYVLPRQQVDFGRP